MAWNNKVFSQQPLELNLGEDNFMFAIKVE